MAKISAYPDGGAVQDSDQFVAARAGSNVSILGSQIGSGSGGGGIGVSATLSNPGAATETDLLQISAGTQGQVLSIVICNRNASARTIDILITNAANTLQAQIVSSYSLGSNDTLRIPGVINLDAQEKIRVEASGSDVDFSANYIEGSNYISDTLSNPGAATETDLLQVSAGVQARVDAIFICNRNASARTIDILITNAANTLQAQIVSSYSLGSNDTLRIPGVINLDAQEKIRVEASGSDVDFLASSVES